MRIAVVGAGGVGGYFGARLAQAGEDVQFLARGAHLAAMRQQGLRLRSVLGDFDLSPAATYASDNPADIGPSQVILFTVKSYDTESAAALLPPLLGPAGRRLEVEALHGELSRRAERLGVPAPATSAIYAVLLPQTPVVTSKT